MRGGSDTSSEAAVVQLRLFRRANPGLSDEELGLAFVKHHYGEALAARVRAYLRSRP
jgi:hypothetical protein